MFRSRTRPAYSEAELAEIYSQPWEFDSAWTDHVARRTTTLESLEHLRSNHLDQEFTAADLSCGDAWFARRFPATTWYLGDFAPGYEFTGPVERTLDLLPLVDLFCLYETLEHLDDPELVLRKIRYNTRYLSLSTPKLAQHDANPQHYWAWDDEAIREMAIEAGFTPIDYRETYPDIGYVFQIWSFA